MENNAAEEYPAEWIHVRLPPDVKREVRIEAAYAGVDMSTWVRNILLEAVERSQWLRTRAESKQPTITP